jgi:hypothetical protein
MINSDAAPQDEDRKFIMIREGGCLCGAVRFKAEGEPINVRICHCRNCQKAMGSPFFARALFDQKALTVEGETARYASSEALDRVFCRICGTRLFAWRKKPAVAGVALAAFDDRNAFTPTDHMWVTEKMDWVGSTTACRNIRGRLPEAGLFEPVVHEYVVG